MPKQFLGLASGLLVSACIFLPALAENVTDTSAGGAIDTTQKGKVESSNKRKLAAKLSGYTIELIRSTPANIIQRSKDETHNGVSGLVGDTTNPLLRAPALAITIPFAATSGFCEGVHDSMCSSWQHAVLGQVKQTADTKVDLPK